MVQPTENLRVRTKIETGKVEEGQQIAIADIEEEVVGPLVVTVLEDVGKRELEQVLIEADCPFDVGSEHSGVMQATRGGLRSLLGRSQVRRAYSCPLLLDGDQIDLSHHSPSPCLDVALPRYCIA